MRILALSNCPLDPSLGSGYVILRYAQGLRERGHSVDLLGPDDYEPLRRWSRGRGTGYRQALGMAAAGLRRVLLGSRGRYDVLELWGGEAWLAIGLLARLPQRRSRRRLLVCHSNGLETHCAELLRTARRAGRPALPRRWYHLDLSPLVARSFRAADALVTVAEFDRRYALREGYAPSDRILAVDNPLPDDYLGLPVDFQRAPVIGYCGSWIPRKGVELIESALPALLRDHPEWRLTLVGVGAGFRAEEHFPADVLPRITVIPFAERGTELRDLYQSFAVLVQPSIYESFGLAAAEAMACGAALVATPVGFAAGLRDREEAMLLPETSPNALHKTLEMLLGDEALRRSVARGGYQRVQTLRWDDAVATVEAAYLHWLDELRSAS